MRDVVRSSWQLIKSIYVIAWYRFVTYKDKTHSYNFPFQEDARFVNQKDHKFIPLESK